MITVPWQLAVLTLFLAALGVVAAIFAIGYEIKWRVDDYRATRAADRDWW